MITKRLFAGSIVALLLSVTPLAAACDLACAFASMKSDCHMQQAASQEPASAVMAMGGMGMAGMSMPGMAGGEGQAAVYENSRAVPAHASIGEMGPCERQACDNGNAVAATGIRFVDLQFHAIFAVVEIFSANGTFLRFRQARDDIAGDFSPGGITPHLNLRI